jgi:hypothetical protein
MKKSKVIFLSTLVGLLLMSTGVYAGANIEKITANINHDIIFKVNNEKWIPKDADGNELAPIIYNGSTYVPLRAIGIAVGSKVDWNANTKTITIDSVNASTYGEPYKDSNGYGQSEGSSESTTVTEDVYGEGTSDTESHGSQTDSDGENNENDENDSSISLMDINGVVDNNHTSYQKREIDGKRVTVISGYTSSNAYESYTKSEFEVLGYQKGTINFKWKGTTDIGVEIRDGEGKVLASKIVDPTNESETTLRVNLTDVKIMKIFVKSLRNSYIEFTILPSSILS